MSKEKGADYLFTLFEQAYDLRAQASATRERVLDSFDGQAGNVKAITPEILAIRKEEDSYRQEITELQNHANGLYAGRLVVARTIGDSPSDKYAISKVKKWYPEDYHSPHYSAAKAKGFLRDIVFFPEAGAPQAVITKTPTSPLFKRDYLLKLVETPRRAALYPSRTPIRPLVTLELLS